MRYRDYHTAKCIHAFCIILVSHPNVFMRFDTLDFCLSCESLVLDDRGNGTLLATVVLGVIVVFYCKLWLKASEL